MHSEREKTCLAHGCNRPVIMHSPLFPSIPPSEIASLMNISGAGFARISGRLRPSRKKILKKIACLSASLTILAVSRVKMRFLRSRARFANEIFYGASKFSNRTI